MTLKNPDNEYLQLMQHILTQGTKKQDRTGTGTTSVFAHQMRFDLSDNKIPLLTTKQMHIPSIVHEIIWYLSGSTNIKYLQDNGIRIWNEWADDNGELGKLYGYMWRKWPDKQNSDTGIDQIQYIIDELITNPDSRRLVVNTWNPTYLPDVTKSFKENVVAGNQALPPCHYAFEFYTNNNKLSCKLTMRSCDFFLGTPFNIAQYGILTHMIAHLVGMEADEFIFSGGNIHIYDNHTTQCNIQLARDAYQSPTIHINPNITNVNDFTFDDITILDYNHHPKIPASVAV